jgi:hypothetical protein
MNDAWIISKNKDSIDYYLKSINFEKIEDLNNSYVG